MSKGIRKTFAEVFELPAEAVCDLPVLTVTGRIEVIVENYGGVIEYSTTKVVLGTKSGILTVNGENMDIKFMNSQCVKISGAIEGLKYDM